MVRFGVRSACVWESVLCPFEVCLGMESVSSPFEVRFECVWESYWDPFGVLWGSDWSPLQNVVLWGICLGVCFRFVVGGGRQKCVCVCVCVRTVLDHERRGSLPTTCGYIPHGVFMHMKFSCRGTRHP